jgi:hypothetical protein
MEAAKSVFMSLGTLTLESCRIKIKVLRRFPLVKTVVLGKHPNRQLSGAENFPPASVSSLGLDVWRQDVYLSHDILESCTNLVLLLPFSYPRYV